MRSQITVYLEDLLFLVLAFTEYASEAYTYEPPGRDPVSVDEIRSSELAVPLTIDNFDELTADKFAFIKFYAPWCPHCKSIAPAWNELAKYYQELPENDSIIIGSIDCTNSPKGKELCARFKIMGLPTLLYGDASSGGIYLEEYGGDKRFDELKSFAAEALVPTCGPRFLDTCSPQTRKEVEKFMAMSYESLDGVIKGKEKQEEDLQTAFKDTFAELQKNYDQSLLRKELQITQARANAMLVKEVIAMKELQ